MQVVLTDFVPNLGEKNDLVEVKPGYANNYLIPQGLARTATKSTLKEIEENRRQAAHRREKELEKAREIAEKLQEIELEVQMLVGQDEKIFGSVTPTQISNLLAEKGIEVDRRRIKLPSDVNELGQFEAEITLDKEVQENVTFNVVPKHD
jgi:large subunit ribosomal protein L9